MESKRSFSFRPDSAMAQAIDITVMGIILAAVTWLAHGKMTGESVIVVSCFLALAFLWRLVWPPKADDRHFILRVFSVAMTLFFGWWLLYAAQNTRAGWYRYHVLRDRVASLVRQSPAYIVLADSTGYIVATSDNIEALTGYAPEELRGQPTTVLMRDAPAAKHMVAYQRAIAALRQEASPSSGWTLQGLLTVAVRHKNGHLVPVRIYAGAIRWSTKVQFEDDIDVFAIMVPAAAFDLRHDTQVMPGEEIQRAPTPPPVRPLSSLPAGRPIAPPANHPLNP